MKILRLFILLLLWASSSSAQSVSYDFGTIYVNVNNSVTLRFPKEIKLIITGNNPILDDGMYKYFEIMQDKRIAIIRGFRADAPRMSLSVILTDESVYYGHLEFGEVTEPFRDFSDRVVVSASDVNAIGVKPDFSSVNELQANLSKVRAHGNMYNSLGRVESGIEFMVTKIMNDRQNSYLFIRVNNNTGSVYNIDGILFKYVEGKRRGLRKKEIAIEERIMPTIVDGAMSVKAYSVEEIGIVIPLFTTGNKGNLEITIRESNGTRNVILTIPGRVMSRVKVL